MNEVQLRDLIRTTTRVKEIIDEELPLGDSVLKDHILSIVIGQYIMRQQEPMIMKQMTAIAEQMKELSKMAITINLPRDLLLTLIHIADCLISTQLTKVAATKGDVWTKDTFQHFLNIETFPEANPGAV